MMHSISEHFRDPASALEDLAQHSVAAASSLA